MKTTGQYVSGKLDFQDSSAKEMFRVKLINDRLHIMIPEGVTMTEAAQHFVAYVNRTFRQHEAERQEKLREVQEHVYRILCLGENSTVRQVAALTLLNTLIETPQKEGGSE